MKLELILPMALSTAALCALILFGTRRLIRSSAQLTKRLIAEAQAELEADRAGLRTELARLETEKAVRAAAEAAGFDLVLTLDAGADADEVFDRVADHIRVLSGYAEAGGGAGLTLDPAQSWAEPGTVTLRLVPTDPRYAAKQREVVMAQSRKIAGVSEVELVTARSRQIAGVSAVEFAAA